MKNPDTWDQILIPDWYEELQKAPGDLVLYRGGERAYPPTVFNRGKWEGYPVTKNINHPVLEILHTMRGRPRKKSIKPGPTPKFSDSLAIKCAMMKNEGKSYINIAQKYGLKTTRPYIGKQSDQAIYLVKKGNKLLQLLKGESG